MFIGADEDELHLRDRVDKQLVAAHVFLPAMLRAAALHLVDSHTANISSKQRIFKNLKLLGTNNRRNLLHSEFLSIINVSLYMRRGFPRCRKPTSEIKKVQLTGLSRFPKCRRLP
jgi:hypothetical protein